MCSCGKKWGKTISLLPTLTPFQRLRNFLFTIKALAQHDLYDKNNPAKFQGQKIHPKKIIQILPTLVAAVESFSLLPTLIASQRLTFFFSMKFLENKPLNVNNIW
jgi:hypothetical protein